MRSRILYSGFRVCIFGFIFSFLFSCTGDPITFSSHIAPIIHKNCTPCHRPGEAGPFSLITYKEVRRRAKMIQFVTENHIMPPWPADPSYSHFIGERVLSDEEMNLIGEWVRNGSPAGDTAAMLPPPVFPAGSQLGKPDLVIKMRTPFAIPGDNRDRFMVMKIPYEIEKDTFIRAIEIIPGNRRLVHHVNGHLVSYEDEKKKDIFSNGDMEDRELIPGQDSLYKKIGLLNDDGSYPILTPSVTNYLPGVTAVIYPDDIGGWKLYKRGAIFLKDIHYGPTPVPQSDQTTFNIFFRKSPPKRSIRETQLGTLGISPVVPPLAIPPNTIKTFRTSVEVAEDISLLTINPHMHLIGKKFLAYAVTPSSDTIPLIRIHNWDFRWQYFYTFKTMLKIPKGSVIVAEGTFDNTADNPFNPFNPPQLIAEREGSMRTTDEMFQFIFTYVPYESGDEKISLENH